MSVYRLAIDSGVAHLTLNRPDVRNAFNADLVQQLTGVLSGLSDDIYALVLTGAGTSFCSGADLAWMKASTTLSASENADDAFAMANLFKILDESPRIVVGRVNGPAMGGGLGLIACCDAVVSVDTAKFGFSEVRLGLIPAVISPFVVNKIGASAARRYFVTGELFGAHQAMAMGLVHKVVEPARLDASVDHILEVVAKNGPTAMAEAKRLVRTLAGHLGSSRASLKQLASWIAELRVSSEAQEGFSAFLNKRPPSWQQRKPSSEKP